jgi:hypothetical protein
LAIDGRELSIFLRPLRRSSSVGPISVRSMARACVRTAADQGNLRVRLRSDTVIAIFSRVIAYARARAYIVQNSCSVWTQLGLVAVAMVLCLLTPCDARAQSDDELEPINQRAIEL